MMSWSKIRLVTIFSIAALTLTACGAATYQKPGASPERVRRDLGLCGASFSKSGQAVYKNQRHLRRIDRCMRRKGYKRVN